MVPNAETQLVHLFAKRPFWSGKPSTLRPGDRSAVRPVRQDLSSDRWLIVVINLGGNHFGESQLRNRILDWETSMFPWLDAHPTAMWDGHEMGCGEFRLLLLAPNPSDLMVELGPLLPTVPGKIRFFERAGPNGGERPLS